MTLETKYRLTGIGMVGLCAVIAAILIWAQTERAYPCEHEHQLVEAKNQHIKALEGLNALLTDRAARLEKDLAQVASWKQPVVQVVQAEPVVPAQSDPVPVVEPSPWTKEWIKAAASETWQQARRYVWSGWRVP